MSASTSASVSLSTPTPPTRQTRTGGRFVFCVRSTKTRHATNVEKERFFFYSRAGGAFASASASAFFFLIVVLRLSATFPHAFGHFAARTGNHSGNNCQRATGIVRRGQTWGRLVQLPLEEMQVTD